MQEHIEPAHWAAFFDDLAKKYDGFEAHMEVIGRAFGDQEAAAWLPFSGISYGRHHNPICITVGGISSRYPVHLTHTIEQPHTVAVHHTPGGEVGSILAASRSSRRSLSQPRAHAGPAHAAQAVLGASAGPLRGGI